MDKIEKVSQANKLGLKHKLEEKNKKRNKNNDKDRSREFRESYRKDQNNKDQHNEDEKRRECTHARISPELNNYMQKARLGLGNDTERDEK